MTVVGNGGLRSLDIQIICFQVTAYRRSVFEAAQQVISNAITSMGEVLWGGALGSIWLDVAVGSAAASCCLRFSMGAAAPPPIISDQDIHSISTSPRWVHELFQHRGACLLVVGKRPVR